MGPRALFRSLESIARRLGLEVRAEALSPAGRGSSRGGVCKVHGRTVVFVEADGPPFDRACVVAEALAGLDLSGVALTEELATFIRSRPRPARLVPLDRFRPLAKARVRLRRQALPAL